MPIMLPPITRHQFVKCSLAIGGTTMMMPRVFAVAGSERAELDQNRVALLADTHISANPRSCLSWDEVAWLSRRGGRA